MEHFCIKQEMKHLLRSTLLLLLRANR